MPFLDRILRRKQAFHAKEDRFAQSMRDEVLSMRDEVVELVKEMPDDVRLKNLLKEVSRISEDGFLRVTSKLEDAKAVAFEVGGLDVAKASQGSVSGAFGQTFDEAAAQSQTRPVLLVDDPLEGTRRWTEYQLRRSISKSVTLGDSVEEAASRVQDIMGITSRAATRIARTNLNASYNDGHQAVIEANDDIFSGYRWSAVFDSRTSTICASLHGKFFPLGSTPPGPPAHPNCRSILVGVFKDPDLNESDTRLVRNADDKLVEVDADIAFDQWLRTQPVELQRKHFQTDVSFQMFQAGVIGTEDLVRPDLVSRTDTELTLRATQPAAERKKIDDRIANEVGVTAGRALSVVLDERASRRLADTIVIDDLPKESVAYRELIKSQQDRDFAEYSKIVVDAAIAAVVGRMTKEKKAAAKKEALASVDKVKEVLQTKVEGLVKNAQVAKRIYEDDLLAALDDGRLKSQFETGTSQGSLDPQYRKRIEAQYGIPNDLDPKLRPIYGYLTDDGVGRPRAHLYPSIFATLDHYGDIAIVFDSSVRGKTTFSGTDSLLVNRVILSPVDQPSVLSLDLKYPDQRIPGLIAASNVDIAPSLSLNPYFEAQIHGGVPLTANTVKEVLIIGRKITTKMKVALEKAGISWREVS